MIPLFRYLLGRGILFWLYFYDLASRSPSFWGKRQFFGKWYIHSIISFCIDFLHLWVKFCIISTIWGHTVLIFAGRKEWRPLGLPLSRGNPQDGPFGTIMYDTTFKIFLVGESDSDFIFTIWHKGNPHSGVKFIFQETVYIIMWVGNHMFRKVSTICGHVSLWSISSSIKLFNR